MLLKKYFRTRIYQFKQFLREKKHFFKTKVGLEGERKVHLENQICK